MDADDVVRHPGGARHRQGALPRSGGRVRRRRGPLLGTRRGRVDRRRVRTARPGDGRPAGARRRRAGDPRRQRGPDEQPHLRLGVRRQGRHRRGVRRRRRRRVAGHAVPAVAPRADGDVRHRRPHGSRVRQAHALVEHAGAARPPHRVRARRRPARAQDPGDRARHRRRVRQQGADLSRLRVLDRRIDRHRQAGQVDGGPLREPDVDRLRPRLPHEGFDRRDARRQDRRAPRRRDRRPRCVQRDRPADEVPGRLLPHLHRLLRLRRRALQGHGRVHEQGARWRRLRVLVPHHRGGLPRRAHRRLSRRRARHGSRRAADEEPAATRAVPVHHTDRLGVRLRRLSARAPTGDGHRRLRRPARRAGRPSERTAS